MGLTETESVCQVSGPIWGGMESRRFIKQVDIWVGGKAPDQSQSMPENRRKGWRKIRNPTEGTIEERTAHEYGGGETFGG